jgi:hypothetical protein
MNLNLSGGGGNGNYIRFSPQANAWSNQDGEFQMEKFVFDYENFRLDGCLLQLASLNLQPDDSLGRKGNTTISRTQTWLQRHFLNKQMGVAEFSANGAGANMGLEALWKQVQAQAPANAGKLPVVEYKGSRPEKVGKGSTRVPMFEVTGWVARPPALADGGGAEPDFSTPAPVQASKPAPTPVAKPAPSPVSDDEMFS